MLVELFFVASDARFDAQPSSNEGEVGGSIMNSPVTSLARRLLYLDKAEGGVVEYHDQD